MTMQQRVMLITGASRGIGRATALLAARSGFAVVVNYANSERAALELVSEIQRNGGDAFAVQADTADESGVLRMFAEIDRRHGRLDVLVNNAGVTGDYCALEGVTADMIRRVMDVNVTGCFICAREAAKRMSTKHGGKGGAIVNVSSRAAAIGGPNEWVHYAASKGAIDTMTLGLAKELGPQGIRVNAVRPGLITTDIHDAAPPGRVDRLLPGVPMARAGSAEEVAEAIVWLASDAASYVSGSFIEVSGGR